MRPFLNCLLSRCDVQTPVRASALAENWIRLSIFKHITCRKPLSEALGCK